MNNIKQRKRDITSPLTEYEEEYSHQKNNSSNSSSVDELNGGNSDLFEADEDGFTNQDIEGKKVKLTLMEEILLIGLRDEQVTFPFYSCFKC